MPGQTRSLHTRSAFPTSQPDLSSLRTEYKTSLPFYSEGASSHLVSTGTPNTIISLSYSIEPSKVGTRESAHLKAQLYKM